MPAISDATGTFIPAKSFAAVALLSSIVASAAWDVDNDACGTSSLCFFQHGAKVLSNGALQASSAEKRSQRSKQPNVLFIMADDLTRDVEGLKGAHPQVQTPNIKALIDSGASFSQSYTSHPLCAPARASILMGIIGSTSGYMTNDASFSNVAAFNNVQSLPQFFSSNGYYTIGTGKIFHQVAQDDHFDEYGQDADYGPVAKDSGGHEVNHPSIPYPLRSDKNSYITAKLSDIPFDGKNKAGWYSKMGQEKTPMSYHSIYNRDQTGDEHNGAWAAAKIKNLSSRSSDAEPWFLAVGFVKPHTPFYLPDKFINMFLLNDTTASGVQG